MASMLKKIKNKDVRMKKGEIWKCVEPAAISRFESPERVYSMRSFIVVADYGDFYHVLPIDKVSKGFAPHEFLNLGYTHQQFAEYYSQGKIKRAI